jgi:hypothetical protein
MRLASCFLLLAVLLTACAARKAAPYAAPLPAAEPGAPLEGRKILYSAELVLAVRDPEAEGCRLPGLAARHGGYVESQDGFRYTLRVEAEQLAAAMDTLAAWGRVEHRSLRSEDATAAYRDDQIRLEHAESVRARYVALLDQAASVQDMLLIEKELERISTEIDLLKSRLRSTDERERLPVLNVVLRERVKPGPVGYLFVGLYRGFAWLFVRN